MEANIKTAQTLFKQNKYQETIDTCKKILDTDTNSIEALKLIAKSFLATRKIDDARLYFNKALNIQSNDYESIKDLGNTYQAVGDINTAKNYYKKAIDINSSFAPALTNLGSIELNTGNKQEGLSLLIKATESDPQLAPAWGNLANGYVQRGKAQEAEIACRKAIELNPNLFNSHFLLGTILLAQKKLQEAEQPLRKTIELKPDFFQAHLNLGAVLKDLGQLQEAKSSYRKAIEIKPDYAEAYSNLGIILKDLGKSQEAELSTRKAIEINPDLAEAHFNLGNILRDLDKLQEAELSCRKAIEIKPDFAEARLSLVAILIDFGKLQEAELLIQKDLDFYSNFSINFYYLSKIYFKKNNLKQAISEIKKAIKNDPKNYTYQAELTRLRYIKGDFDDTSSSIKPWSNKDDFVFEDNNKDVLLVIFGSYGRKEKGVFSFDFYNLFKENTSFNKLFLRDIKQNWYLNGLQNNTNNLKETIDLLKKLITHKKYKKVVSLGDSSGGFAAILFGNLLNFQKVIAFNPQTIISELHDKDISITLGRMNTADRLYQKCLNLKNFIPFSTQVEIHYSQFSPIDTKHALFIEHQNCQCIKHKFGGHLLTPELKEKGLLKDLILNSLNLFKTEAS